MRASCAATGGGAWASGFRSGHEYREHGGSMKRKIERDGRRMRFCRAADGEE